MCWPSVESIMGSSGGCTPPDTVQQVELRAQSEIRAYLGADPCLHDFVVELDGSGTKLLLLPCVPIEEVTRVEVREHCGCGGGGIVSIGVCCRSCGTEPSWREVDCWDAFRDGRLRRRRCPWPDRARSVRVIGRAGFERLPGAIIEAYGALVRRMVEGGVNAVPPDRLTSERSMSWSATFRSESIETSGVSSLLTSVEMARLDRFRPTRGYIQ